MLKLRKPLGHFGHVLRREEGDLNVAALLLALGGLSTHDLQDVLGDFLSDLGVLTHQQQLVSGDGLFEELLGHLESHEFGLEGFFPRGP